MKQPALGTVHLHKVGRLLESLEQYQAPLEVRRKRESLGLWRPHYEELLACLQMTVEETWPFQVYPSSWNDRVQDVVKAVDEALSRDVDCHFPQQSTSNFRLIHRLLKRSLQDSQSLSGREVGLARQVLLDSVDKWGPLGSAERASRLFQDLERANPVERLIGELRALEPELGWSSRPASTPRFLSKRVSRARQATPKELLDDGTLKSLNDLAHVSQQLLAQCVGPEGGDAALQFAKQLTQLSWTYFPWEAPNSKLLMVRDQLLQLAGKSDCSPSTESLWKETLYSRYYGLPVQPSQGTLPRRQLAEIQQLLCAAHTFYGLHLGESPEDALGAAKACWASCQTRMGEKMKRPYQVLLRHRKIAQAWQNMLFFLSLCEGTELEGFLLDAMGTPVQSLREHVVELKKASEGEPPVKVLLQWVESDEEMLS